MGLNTEDSPIGQDFAFADIADNAIIDKQGRLAARKGIRNLTTVSATELGTDRVHKVHHFYDNVGNEVTFTTGNNKIMTGVATLVDATPANYTITNNNWKIVNFNNHCYFFQQGYEPLVYSDALNAVTPMSSVTDNDVTSAQYCHDAIGAYGRLWCTGTASDKNTIYWSDLLLGHVWYGGSSGSIDVSKAWPDGYDEIQAIVAHNNLLLVFGEHSILVFANASSPANMALQDTISGIGCVDRNTVQVIGTDVLFLSQSGLRSIGRVIQEKSLPITDLSRNIKAELLNTYENTSEPLASVYSPENSFYLLTFPDQTTTYCFDLRGNLENGAYRVTRWPSGIMKAWHRKVDGTVLCGTTAGVADYAEYFDLGEGYTLNYASPSLTFGDASKIKMLKKIRPTILGGNGGNAVVYWGFDLSDAYKSVNYSIGTESYGEFNVDEYLGYSELSGLGITSSFVSDASGVFFQATGLTGYYTVNKYLGEFATAPTTGSGGGALLDGDSYFNTTSNDLFVRVSGAWTNAETLTVTTSTDYSGGTVISRASFNATGSGTLVTIGVQADIAGSALSVQEVNVLALIGKMI